MLSNLGQVYVLPQSKPPSAAPSNTRHARRLPYDRTKPCIVQITPNASVSEGSKMWGPGTNFQSVSITLFYSIDQIGGPTDVLER